MHQIVENCEAPFEIGSLGGPQAHRPTSMFQGFPCPLWNRNPTALHCRKDEECPAQGRPRYEPRAVMPVMWKAPKLVFDTKFDASLCQWKGEWQVGVFGGFMKHVVQEWTINPFLAGKRSVVHIVRQLFVAGVVIVEVYLGRDMRVPVAQSVSVYKQRVVFICISLTRC